MLSTLGQSPVDVANAKIDHNQQLSIIFKDIPQRFQCCLCKQLLKDPVQSADGSSACSTCYDRALSNGICPLDKKPIADHKMFKDIAIAREIEKYKCSCLNFINGCPWKGTLSTLQKHLSCCSFERKKCEFCDSCYDPHNEFVHMTECVGVYRNGYCFFKIIGCSYQTDSKEDMIKHLKTGGLEHLQYQARFSKKIMGLVDGITAKMFEQSDEQGAMKLDVAVLKNDMQESVEKLKNVYENNPDPQNPVERNLKRVENFEGENNSKLQKELKEMKVQLERLLIAQNNNDLQMQLNENGSIDGHLLWKVENYRHRKQQADNGKVVALHSAPSTTSKYGYKFCARLYLNGDRSGKGTHLSLYLVIMKSPYDSLLEWPFTRKARFTLVNQMNREKDIVKQVPIQHDSNRFGRPVKEMNTPSGFPNFLTIERLEKNGFLKDDCIFVDIKVE